MISWGPDRVAAAAGARLLRGPRGSQGPRRAAIDSRAIRSGDLFIGLVGERTDGGMHAAEALAAGAWGALLAPEHAASLEQRGCAGALLTHERPLEGLQALASAWREELVGDGARVIAITGSTGKTSTKDILAALLRPHLRVCASPANLNTEIGLPLAILAAPHGTEALVLEMAMRGPGQIGALTEIARPHVGLIVNVGPVHLGLLGSLDAIAAAKAELIEGLPGAATAIVPAGEPLLEPYLRAELRTITFGEGGDLELARGSLGGEVLIVDRTAEQSAMIRLLPSFSQAHNLRNLLAAVAAARALGITPRGRLEVSFSSLRGERVKLPGGIVLINDCYNANPISMRAALEDLRASASGRRVAVLGDMLELGPGQLALHRELTEHARAADVQLLVTVGPLAAAIGEQFAGVAHSVDDAGAAAELLNGLLRSGDTVLIKGSRGVGLERVAAVLAHEAASRQAS